MIFKFSKEVTSQIDTMDRFKMYENVFINLLYVTSLRLRCV
jgi:hypothetical protein